MRWQVPFPERQLARTTGYRYPKGNPPRDPTAVDLIMQVSISVSLPVLLTDFGLALAPESEPEVMRQPSEATSLLPRAVGTRKQSPLLLLLM